MSIIIIIIIITIITIIITIIIIIIIIHNLFIVIADHFQVDIFLLLYISIL